MVQGAIWFLAAAALISGCSFPWAVDCADGPWNSLWTSPGTYDALASRPSQFEVYRWPGGAYSLTTRDSHLLNATGLPGFEATTDGGILWLSTVGWDSLGYHDHQTMRERNLLEYRMIEEGGQWRPALIGRFTPGHDIQAVRDAAEDLILRLTGETGDHLDALVDAFVASKERDGAMRKWAKADIAMDYFALRDLAAPKLGHFVVQTHQRASISDSPLNIITEDGPWWFLWTGSFVQLAGVSGGDSWQMWVNFHDRVNFISDNEDVPLSRHVATRDAAWKAMGLTTAQPSDSAVYDYSCIRDVDLSAP